MHRVLEINQIDQLSACAAAWRELLVQTPAANFFQSLEWLEVYWRHFGAGQRLRVLVVLQDGQIAGIVPLVVRKERKRFADVRVLTYPLHDWGTFYGPIGPDPAAALEAAIQHIRSTPRDWDMIDIRWVSQGEHEYAWEESATARAMSAGGFPVRSHLWKRVAVIDTTGSWESYLASRKQSLRGSIRRYERRLAQLGDVQFERYRPQGHATGDCDPRWEDYDACVTLARRSWQGNATDGTTLSHDAVHDFLRDAHAAATRFGAVDMNMLKLNGKLIAFAYNYHCQGVVQGLRTGFDPDYAPAGVGKLLWARSFRDSFRRQDSVYDIGPDSLPIKTNWLTRILPVFAYAYYPPTVPKVQLLRLAHLVRDLRRLSAESEILQGA